MNDGIEGNPGWAESLDYLAWRGGHISLGAKAIGELAHSDMLDEAGNLGYKLSKIGFYTLDEAAYLGIKLAGIGVRLSALPASLPSLAVCSREAIEALTHMGAGVENGVQFMKSSGYYSPMGPSLVSDIDRVAESAASAVTNLRAGTPTLRDLTKLAWAGDAVRRFAVLDMRSYASNPGLLATNLISPVWRLAEKAFGSSVTDAPTR
jgi:hypothetical protein